MKKNVLCAFVLCLLLSATAFAGEITGVIYYEDGSKCSSCRVSASIKRSGVTDQVYTNNKGEFHLRWSSDNSIDELYVNGTTRRRNIKSGEYVVIYLD